MAFQCPKCKRKIYNRRRTTCEFCGAALPDSVRLSPVQEKFLDEVRAEEIRQHKNFMAQEFPGAGDASLADDDD